MSLHYNMAKSFSWTLGEDVQMQCAGSHNLGIEAVMVWTYLHRTTTSSLFPATVHPFGERMDYWHHVTLFDVSPPPWFSVRKGWTALSWLGVRCCLRWRSFCILAFYSQIRGKIGREINWWIGTSSAVLHTLCRSIVPMRELSWKWYKPALV